MQKERILTGVCLLWLSALPLAGQPESESPYSDQAYDPVDNPVWWETPFLWIGIVAFTLVLAFAIYRIGRRRRIKAELHREKEKRAREEEVSS